MQGQRLPRIQAGEMLDRPLGDRPRVLVFGHLGVGNIGDDAMLPGVLRAIHRAWPEATLAIAAGAPLPELLPEGIEATFIPRTLGSLACALFRCNTFVLAGGTHLASFQGDGRHTWGIVRHAVIYWLARLLGLRVYLAGVGFGPFQTRMGRRLARLAVAAVDYITVRDQDSFNCLAAVGYPRPRIGRCDDPALFLDLPGREVLGPHLGISVLPYFANYASAPALDGSLESRIVEIIGRWLAIHPSSRVSLVPFYSARRNGDDCAISRRIADRIADPRVAVADPCGRLDTCLEGFRRYTHFVSMRYHSQVLAWLLRIPQVVVAYHAKNRSFAEFAGMPRSCVFGMEAFVGGEATSAIETLFRATAPQGADPTDKVAADRLERILPTQGVDAVKRPLEMLEIIQDNRLGGISVRAIAAAERLREKGIESAFVLPSEPGDVADVCRGKGYTVCQTRLRRPHPRRAWQTLRWALDFPFAVARLTWLIVSRRVDVVHVNGFVGLQAAAAAAITRTPLVWHLADTSSYPRWLVRIVRPWLNRSTAVVAISRRVREYFLGNGPARDNECVIHEPVDLAAIRRRMQENTEHRVRRELGLSQDDTILSTIGNLSPRKGTLVLVEAARTLCARYPKLRIVAVGALLETQREYLSQVRRAVDAYQLQDRFFLLGKRSDVYEILQESNIFVLPSFSEGTPISILEAMALRVPVIASNVGGIPDQIEDGVSGLLVPPGDAQSLAAAVTRLIETPGLGRGLAENAFQKVTEHFDLEQFVESFSETVHRACRRTAEVRQTTHHSAPSREGQGSRHRAA